MSSSQLMVVSSPSGPVPVGENSVARRTGKGLRGLLERVTDRGIAAIYGPTGQVISPCEKCRQVLFDRDPAIQCVVRAHDDKRQRRRRDV